MVRPGADGGSTNGYISGRSAATPAQLNTAGHSFQQFANYVGGMAKSDDLKSGGEFEKAIVAAHDVALGASSNSFEEHLGEAARAFLGVLISAYPQLADAACDLFDSAGDFAKADTAMPSNATYLETSKDGVETWVVHTDTPLPMGVRMAYLKDREGHVRQAPPIGWAPPSAPPGRVQPGPALPGPAPSPPAPHPPR